MSTPMVGRVVLPAGPGDFTAIARELQGLGYGVVKARKTFTRRPPGWAGKQKIPKTYGKDAVRDRRRG
jgi:hypothetical protein